MHKPDIIFQDDDIIVVNKPCGLLTQAPSGIDSIEFRFKQWLKDQSDQSGKTYLGVPHRLDRPASGVMVFGLNKKSARRLAEQFSKRTVKKAYWAIVTGNLQEKTGTWTDYMRKIPDRAQSEIVAEDHPDAQQAVLHYKLIESVDDNHLISIELETGRTHQIRLQTSSRELPILGDELYGSGISFGPHSDDSRQRWIALHAREIEFVHPTNRKELGFVAPTNSVWREIGFVEDQKK